jgi:hypothetical protein
MPKGQPSPGDLRSSRKRALEVGARPDGFEDLAAGYDPAAGVPPEHAGGSYTSPVDGTPDPGAPVENPSPFKLGQ